MTDTIRSWFPSDPEPTAEQLRKERLADSVRTLIADVLLVDSSEAGAEALAEAERLLTAAGSAIAALPSLRGKGGVFGSEDDVSLFQRSPISGRSNALAAPLAVRFDGVRTLATATYGDAYEGPPGSVHGGHVIAAFDELLGVAQAASGTAGFTGTLTVRLVGRTPLHERIDFEAGVQEQAGRKVIAWGRSYCAGELLAEATGIFIVPREGMRIMLEA